MYWDDIRDTEIRMPVTECFGPVYPWDTCCNDSFHKSAVRPHASQMQLRNSVPFQLSSKADEQAALAQRMN